MELVGGRKKSNYKITRFQELQKISRTLYTRGIEAKLRQRFHHEEWFFLQKEWQK